MTFKKHLKTKNIQMHYITLFKINIKFQFHALKTKHHFSSCISTSYAKKDYARMQLKFRSDFYVKYYSLTLFKFLLDSTTNNLKYEHRLLRFMITNKKHSCCIFLLKYNNWKQFLLSTLENKSDFSKRKKVNNRKTNIFNIHISISVHNFVFNVKPCNCYMFLNVFLKILHGRLNMLCIQFYDWV